MYAVRFFLFSFASHAQKNLKLRVGKGEQSNNIYQQRVKIRGSPVTGVLGSLFYLTWNPRKWHFWHSFPRKDRNFQEFAGCLSAKLFRR